TMNNIDHEYIEYNEKERVVNSDTIMIDASKKTHHAIFIGKCGGEVRIELEITFKQNASGSISVKETAKLFEGASTNSTDLDGTASKAITVAKNESKVVVFRVNNTDDGGDY